jgi:peptidoglycan/xylan/chitin deacetylase (PgdA/CDA1 family)
MTNVARWLSTLILVALSLKPSLAQQRTVAITFDDLPIADTTGTRDAIEAQSINQALLAALDRHKAPATIFVIEKRIHEIGADVGKEILRQWFQYGHDLGNHSLSHTDFDRLSAVEMQQEIVLGEATIAAVLAEAGKKPRYFRFPMNHTGDTAEKHQALISFLAKRGYTLATCTIDNEDYLFDRAYQLMRAKGDRASAERLRAEYLTYTSTEIDYYSRLHKQVLGYEPPHVMLLHANQLNADTINQVLALFEAKHYTFVTLDQAQSDPAYQQPDTFVSSFGPMWGYRWAAERHIKIDGSLEQEPPAWISSYADSNPQASHR